MKNIFIIISALAFVISSIVCFILLMESITHAFSFPSLTLTQNILYFLFDLDAKYPVTVLVVSYFALVVSAKL